MPQGPQQSRKKCVTFLRGGGGGFSEKRPYDVSRGQNRYVTLPLVEVSIPAPNSLVSTVSILGIGIVPIPKKYLFFSSFFLVRNSSLFMVFLHEHNGEDYSKNILDMSS